MPQEADAPCLLCHRRKPRARGPARSMSPSQQPASSPACPHLTVLLVSTLSPCLSLPAERKLREVGPWLPQPLPPAKLEQHPHSRAQRGGLARGGSDTPHPAPGWPNDRCSAHGPLLPSGQGGGAGNAWGLVTRSEGIVTCIGNSTPNPSRAPESQRGQQETGPTRGRQSADRAGKPCGAEQAPFLKLGLAKRLHTGLSVDRSPKHPHSPNSVPESRTHWAAVFLPGSHTSVTTHIPKGSQWGQRRPDTAGSREGPRSLLCRREPPFLSASAGCPPNRREPQPPREKGALPPRDTPKALSAVPVPGAERAEGTQTCTQKAPLPLLPLSLEHLTSARGGQSGARAHSASMAPAPDSSAPLPPQGQCCRLWGGQTGDGLPPSLPPACQHEGWGYNPSSAEQSWQEKESRRPRGSQPQSPHLVGP